MIPFAAIIAVPLPILAGLLLYRIITAPNASFVYLSLRHRDVLYAIRAFTLAFLALFVLQAYALLSGQRAVLVTSLVGTIFTVAAGAALIILNIVVRGPTGKYYHYLPATWVSPAAETVRQQVSTYLYRE